MFFFLFRSQNTSLKNPLYETTLQNGKTNNNNMQSLNFFIVPKLKITIDLSFSQLLNYKPIEKKLMLIWDKLIVFFVIAVPLQATLPCFICSFKWALKEYSHIPNSLERWIYILQTKNLKRQTNLKRQIDLNNK